MNLARTIAVLLILTPAVAAAVSPGPWGAIYAGYGSYSMADLNSTIEEINGEVGRDILDTIDGGLLLGLNVGYQLPSRFGFGLGYERLDGGMRYSAGSEIFEINVPANVFKALFEYHIPATSSAWMYLSGELGVISTAGDALLMAGGDRITADYEGSSLYAAGVLGVAIPLGNSGEIHGQAGYRYVEIGEIKVDGETLYMTDGGKMTHDYSGLLLRLGLRVVFGSTGAAE